MSIQPLPEDVVAQIKSSAIITSLGGVVCGLLQNSLDAGASRIKISVDYSRGNCSAEDNGVGIAPASFQEDGGLGKLHYTSKYPPRPGCHGNSGEFLASLASLSLLSVASHHKDYRTHNSLAAHNSRVVARNLPAPPEQRVLAFASGTRVTVRDLFGSMPVRVKQRAIEAERVGTSRDFEHLIFNIVALLLPWPREVAVSVQESYARRTVTLQASEVVDGSQPYRSTAPGILSRTTMLLAQASMVDQEDLKSWVPIGATASGISVRGCVSLQPVATKRVQFIAIGIRPLLNEHRSNIFYEDVNRVFEDSSFGVIEEATLDDHGRPVRTQAFTGKELKPKRGIDRWPMFFLQVTLSSGADSVDVEQFLDERHQNAAVVTDLLQVMAYEFLKKHHFRPRSITAIERLKQQNNTSFAPTPQPSQVPSSGQPKGQTRPEVKRPRSKPQSRRHTPSPHTTSRVSEGRASPFAFWSRTKSTIQQGPGPKSPPVSTSGLSAQHTFNGPSAVRRPSPAMTEKPLFDKSGILLRKPFDDVDEKEATPKTDVPGAEPPGAGLSSETGSERETVVWVDSNTKIKSLIDPRTGFAVKQRNNAEHKLLSRLPRHQTPKDVPRIREWKPAAIGEQNIVFQAREPRIAQVLHESEIACCGHGDRNREFQEPSDLADLASGNIRATLEARISKSSLQKAEVVAQVDRKFILTKVDTNSPSSPTSARNHGMEPDRLLILIDQHAADERCRVEALLRAYFVPDPESSSQLVAQTQSPDKPLRFDLSRQDGELLVRFQGHFAHWGIAYEVFRGDEAPPQRGVTVEVQLLPPSILERCRLEPRLLVDLLRKEIWKLHSTGSHRTGGLSRVGTDSDWVARFHDCPEGILDLINSRACRSAIMFNDPLTVQQCSDLVQELAVCAFPFQCAHGRPSMVPLVHLGEGSTLGLGSGEPGGDGDLLGALKRMKRD